MCVDGYIVVCNRMLDLIIFWFSDLDDEVDFEFIGMVVRLSVDFGFYLDVMQYMQNGILME